MAEPTIIAPSGEIDVARLGEFRAELAGAVGGADGLVVDLSDVSFIDSGGLGALLEVHERLRRQNRRLAVVAPRGTSPAVVLTLTGLRRRLSVFESRRDALSG